MDGTSCGEDKVSLDQCVKKKMRAVMRAFFDDSISASEGFVLFDQ